MRRIVYNISEIEPYINWLYFYHAWGLSGKRDLNPRPQPWQGCALPTELLPHHVLL